MSLATTRRSMCAMMACTILSVLPARVFAQATASAPPLTPGVHHLTFQRPGAPTVSYAISIPPNYSPSTPVPLILALHFGVGNGSGDGAGGDVLEILVGPGLAQLGAIIVAPDSLQGNWSTPENEK